MLALSAATRAVTDEPLLQPAATALAREACRLTGSAVVTVVILDWARRITWSCDGALLSEESRTLIAQIARTGQRAVFGASLLEPIGSAPARAVLVLRRTPGARFEADDVALISALIGGVTITLHRLIAAAQLTASP
jgi:hypothetical protein